MNIASKEKRQFQSNGATGLDLSGIGDLSGLLEQPGGNADGNGPLHLEIALIDEDPHQPRTDSNPGFSAESLGELAETIRLRGVKTPISVREHPEGNGRFIINHGARRTRASKLAGKTTIPAFIDNDYNEADQVIENLQRNELTAREIADFIGRELAKGSKKGDIAKSIGKSAAYITQHVTLLDLPEPIAEAFNAGRTKDVTVVNELVTLYKKNPDDVTTWLADDNQELTRGAVKLLKEYLGEKSHVVIHESSEDMDEAEAIAGEEETESAATEETEKAADSAVMKKPIVRVSIQGKIGRLLLTKRPTSAGWVWVRTDDDGAEFECKAASVRLHEVMEG